MDYYDPDVAPDPAAWLGLDEALRLVLVEDYHREARIKMPKRARRLHAVFHTVVENQLAMDDQQIVRETLERLINEGLSRHDAVHAVGSVLAGHVFNVVKAGDAASTDHAAYYDALKALTVDKWRSG
jgi:hypothetical protein